jgi:phage regulator Rha-like protein
MPNSISVALIANKVLEVRGKKVMLDSDLAKLYGVETKQLLQQVKRNIKRFPDDFMYHLTSQEVISLRCQFGISNLRSQSVTSSWGGRRYLPYVFTQEGVAMLSSVLNSDRAIQVNILIMRAFVKLKEIFVDHTQLAYKLNELERRVEKHDKAIKEILDAIRQLITPPEKPKRRIGFYSE